MRFFTDVSSSPKSSDCVRRPSDCASPSAPLSQLIAQLLLMLAAVVLLALTVGASGILFS